MKLTTLYRPVGETELQLIKESGYKNFPPRLAWQPIFYPVLNETYATQIASEWNAQDAFSGYAGHVLAFNVPDDFLSRYRVQNVGGTTHNELWIPAEELAYFNEQIAGPIRVLHSHYGPLYKQQPNGKTT